MNPFSDREENVARPPENISSKEWGERHRELSILTSASAGRWTANMIPFLVPVLDALDDPDIEVVVLQKSTQIAGTETFLTWLGKVADQDPGPAMMCFADEDTADEVIERRVQPMFRTSMPISRHIEEARFNKKGITLLNNFSLTPAWASSIAKTASRPIRYLYLSEITKPGYGMAGDEGSVLTRIFQRTETFPNKKIAIETTPTIEGDNIDKQMQLCEVVYDWHVPCPMCGSFQPLRFSPQKYRTIDGTEAVSGSVIWPDGESARERASHARYECGECKERWTTAQKNAAVSMGRPVPRTPTEHRARRVGFHISRLYSLFPGGRLESLAEAFLLAKSDLLELQSFCNNALAEHWKTYRVSSTADELKKAKCETPWQVVPDVADCITVSIDMQQTGFWYTVRAWSSRLKDSWMIECGQIGGWDDVEELFFERTWKKEKGAEIGCWRGALDVGGTKEEGKDISRTEEAEAWWVDNRRRTRGRIFLCKGSSKTSMPTKISIGKILETTPSGKKIAHGGLQIVELNTNALKDLFFHAIDQAIKQESGAAFLCSDTPDAYFKHITAEAKENDGTYKRIGRDNHWLDTEMMHRGLVSRELHGGLDAVARRNAPLPPPASPKPQPPAENPYLSGSSPGNPYIQR